MTVHEALDPIVASPYAQATAAMILWAFATAAVVWFVRDRVHAYAAGSATKLDDIVVAAISGPLALALLVVGAIVVESSYDVLPPSGERAVDIAGPALLIVLAAYAVSKLLVGLLHAYGHRSRAGQAVGAFGVYLVRVGVYGIALMLVMSELGVTITPLLTAFGLGGLAIALALQDTLSNFFAGIYITSDRSARVDDYIELDSGHRGFVVNRSWRSVHIRELPNNIIIIPNAKLAASVVKNFHLPETEMAALVQVGVSYDSDLAHVERVTVETGREVLERTEGAVADFEPFIRYHTFGDFAIQFTVILRVNQFVDQYLLKHEFVKALHKRYSEEGIVIPFPIRTLEFADGDVPDVLRNPAG